MGAAQGHAGRGETFGRAAAGESLGKRGQVLDAVEGGQVSGRAGRAIVSGLIEGGRTGEIDGRAETPGRRERERGHRRDMAQGIAAVYGSGGQADKARAADAIEAVLETPEGRGWLDDVRGLDGKGRAEALEALARDPEAAVAGAGADRAGEDEAGGDQGGRRRGEGSARGERSEPDPTRDARTASGTSARVQPAVVTGSPDAQVTLARDTGTLDGGQVPPGKRAASTPKARTPLGAALSGLLELFSLSRTGRSTTAADELEHTAVDERLPPADADHLQRAAGLARENPLLANEIYDRAFDNLNHGRVGEPGEVDLLTGRPVDRDEGVEGLAIDPEAGRRQSTGAPPPELPDWQEGFGVDPEARRPRSTGGTTTPPDWRDGVLADPVPEPGQFGDDVVKMNRPYDPGDVYIAPDRQTHILDGDPPPLRGGGHRPGTGRPGKSEFPESWSDDKILEAIEEVAKRGDVIGRANNPEYLEVSGVVEDVEITVIVADDGEVITGFPDDGPGMVHN